MSKYVETIEANETVQDAVQRVVDLVHDRKSPYKPGQYLFVHADNSPVVKVVTVTGLSNRVEQSYAKDVDVNRLLEPAMKKGLLRHVAKFEGEYDDIPAADFQAAQFIVAKGKSMFEALPSRMRERFNGNPAEFMEFVQDPANEGWLREHGIIEGIDGADAAGRDTGYTPQEPPEGPQAQAARAPAGQPQDPAVSAE